MLGDWLSADLKRMSPIELFPKSILHFPGESLIQVLTRLEMLSLQDLMRYVLKVNGCQLVIRGYLKHEGTEF